METHNKLIRDKVPADLISRNITHTVHKATEDEYAEKLGQKIVEEAVELNDAMTKEELADLLQVIESFRDFKGWTTLEIEEIRLKKLAEKGGFEDRIILEKCEKKAL